MRFTTFVIKNITRRRARSVLTICGLGVAVGAVVALVGIAEGFQGSLKRLYEDHHVDMVVVKAGLADRGTSALDESLGERIAKIAGVKAVDPSLMDAVSFEDVSMFGVPVQGLKADSGIIQDHKFSAGRPFRPDETKVALLGQITAKKMNKGVGDKIEIFEDEIYEILGVYESYSVFENGALIIPLSELQRLLDRPGQVNGFNVRLENPTDRTEVERVRSEIEKLDATLSAMPTEDYVNSDNKMAAATAMAWSTSTIALIVGAIGMLNTMIMSVFERTREIGILRAIGWRKSRVVRMILMEAVVLSLLGAVVGTIAAFGMIEAISRTPTGQGMVDSRIELHVVGLGFLIATCIGLFGAAYPAYVGARLLPTEALRHE
jgi:putative ABC transport system permease protein